jgi:hypothetical protein
MGEGGRENGGSGRGWRRQAILAGNLCSIARVFVDYRGNGIAHPFAPPADKLY